VILNVVARHVAGQDTLAAISFAFDRDAEYAGPSLDPLIVQSPYAEALLEIVTPIIESDTAFVAQLESRYRQAKQAGADPNHPVHQKPEGYLAEGEKGLNRPRRRKKRKK
jgi:hypothetical protein